jgi:hypothetical protein
VADIFDLGFDARNVEPTKEMGAIPAGDYQVVLIKSERKPNSKGTGELLALEFAVLNGDFQNRKLFATLNIRNQNETAQKIALAELSALCRAVEVMAPKDTAELHNRPLIVTVKVEDDPQRGKQNRITAYKHRNAGRPQQQPINAQPAGAHQFAQQAAPQQLDPFGNGPTPPPPAAGVYQQPQQLTTSGPGKAWG